MSGTGSNGSNGRGWSNARQRALRQWRRVDLDPLEKARALSARSAGALMPRVMKTLGLDRRRAEAEIVRVWKDLIDPEVTAHAQPVNLHKGTLFVNVDSPVWKDEITRYRRHDILRRMQSSFGREAIKRISFRIG
ncbi:MAG: hypothetical protein ACI9VS_002479 [Candidatus Binatia bacterium]|jgi:hypothetical protein